MAEPWLRIGGDSVLVDITLQPSAPKTRVVGVRADRLRVQIAAPPEDGEANEELRRFLAKLCGVSPNDVEVTRGAASRKKTVRLSGVRLEVVEAALLGA